MKPQLIAAGAAVAAVGALGLGIPAAEHTHLHDVALTATDINEALLSLEGVSSPPAELPATPLGTVADGNFYNVITSETFSDGQASNVDSTVAASDLLNSSLVTQANEAAGIGYTNGYIGLSPTETPDTSDTFTFMDQEGVDFDHGLQALLTAFNQPVISLEEAYNASQAAGATPAFDPAELNLDPADLGGDSGAPLTLPSDLTVAFLDFSSAAESAFGASASM